MEALVFLLCNVDHDKEEQSLNVYNHIIKKKNLDNSEHSLSNYIFPIFLKLKNSNNVIYLNFTRHFTHDKYEQDKKNIESYITYDKNDFTGLSYKLLAAFKEMITENEIKKITGRHHNQTIWERVDRIDFLTSKKSLDNLSYNYLKTLSIIIPFNSDWVDNNLRLQTFFDFGDILYYCNLCKPWFIIANIFLERLNHFYTSLGNDNILKLFRKTEKNEFPLPLYKDSKNNFWCLAFHGTPLKKTGRKIGKTKFIPSIGGLYGPGVYFSNMLQKNLDYTRDGGHILVCFVCLGNNPVFTTRSGGEPQSTGIIALAGLANHHKQIHTEIIVKDPEKIITFYSITLENKSLCSCKTDLTPIIHAYDNNLKKSIKKNIMDIKRENLKISD